MNIQRRINHTGRKRIDKSRVEIFIEEKSGDRRFRASVDFNGLDLPPGAPVYIEAYQRYALQRFDCGTVGNFALPRNTALDKLDSDLPIQFRVKVVDTVGSKGRLIAAARGIRASNEQPDGEGRERLLPVVSRDLGEVPWQVNFSYDSMPELALNNRIPDCINRIRQDRLFQALVLPAAVRSILLWIYWREPNNDEDGENGENWATRWLDFAKSIVDEDPPDPRNTSEIEKIEEWIEDVVRKFSLKHRLCQRLIEQIGGTGE
jgi:hypothetical protein